MTDPGATALQPVRLLTMSMGLAPLAFLAVVSLTVGFEASPWWPFAVVGAVALAASLGSVVVLTQLAGLPPEATTQDGWRVTMSTHVLRLALLETPALVGLLVSFVIGSAWPIVMGAPLAAALIFWLAYPSARVVGAYETQLNKNGAQIRLS